jgi:glycosyltransferase involved in cell wall biosynthesis
MKKIIFLDSSLIDYRGHGYEYNKNLASVFIENGWDLEIYGNKKTTIKDICNTIVQSTFSFSPTDNITNNSLIRPLAKIFLHLIFNGREIRSVVKKNNHIDTIFFIQHLEWYQMPGIYFGLKNSKGISVLMLRSTSLSGPSANNLSIRSFVYKVFLALLRMSLNARLKITTDSDELKNEFENITNLSVTTMPIPNQIRQPTKGFGVQGQPINIAYLGRASIEKGFGYLPGIIKEIRRQKIPANFVIHAYENDTKKSIELSRISDELQLLGNINLQIIKNPLTTDEYKEQLTQIDYLLLIYNKNRYANQTSGLLLDALHNKIFPITCKNTWLANQVQESQYGYVLQGEGDRISIEIANLIKNKPSKNFPSEYYDYLSWHTNVSFFKIFVSMLS